MREVADLFKALGDEQRLKILDYLASGAPCCGPGDGICACDVQEFAGLAQATVSHHMKILVQADLVSAEKRGKWVYYSLEPEGFKIAQEALAAFADRARSLIPLEVQM
jgi:ArsR family transcriptional regulator, arsenate/arsenite/antimonite-responsive transcriptional repressor